MNHATTTIRQKLVILTGVLVVHALLLWGLPGVLAPQQSAEVIAVKLVSQWIAPAPESAKAQQRAVVPAAISVSKQATPAVRQPGIVSVPDASSTTRPEHSAAPAAPAVIAVAAGVGEAPAAGAGGNAKPVQGAVAGTGTSSALTGPSNAAAGNHVELPSSDADYLHNPKPEYPRLSRQRNEQGKVVVNVLIGVDGTAQKAEIKSSSGFERLDQAALATAKAWRYVPGKRGGVPEAMWFAVPINFVME